ncbi:acyl carrier protein [Streptomyces sp. NPDC057413]|uniref:acyl carrier protein n=1 Tax=Streptomyces sp. NPDC057413 TaxID=3346124 RepID=UPI0036C9ABC9
MNQTADPVPTAGPAAATTAVAAGAPTGGAGAGATALSVLVEEVARILDRPPAALAPGLHLQHDLGFDSVMMLQLLGRLEERFPRLRGAGLPDVLPGVQTLGALAGRLARLTGAPVT